MAIEASGPEPTDVWRFMELRAPYTPDLTSARRNYIRDDVVGAVDDRPGYVPADLQTAKSGSAIGPLVFNEVFCAASPRNDSIVDAAVSLLPTYRIFCPEAPVPTSAEAASARPLSLGDMERHSYLLRDGIYHLIPEQVDDIGIAWSRQIRTAAALFEKARLQFDLAKLVQQLESVFNTRPLSRVVFERQSYTPQYQQTKRSLFDALYILYVVRRRVNVSFEQIIEALRVLHVLEALAIDGALREIRASGNSPLNGDIRRIAESIFPELLSWNGSEELATLPLIDTVENLALCLRATPIIHPIFARLTRYAAPFNEIKPIGIGEFKVVRQWLVAYLPGEIARVENILKGECNYLQSRKLEKTEETFSFSSSSREVVTTEIETTDRFELKREIENVVQTQLAADASANVTYTGVSVVANVKAGFSYKRDTTEQNKSAAMFARETVTKAIHSVETAVAQARSATKIFESELTEKHEFDNREGDDHVRGIYRWLDKKYKAQIYNFGKRMMFEFVVPEPASFFVEARLRGFEASLDCPQKPDQPKLKVVDLGFGPSDIDENKFRTLYTKYGLGDFEFPGRVKRVAFVNQETGANFFKEDVSDGGSVWYAKSYTCRIDSKGYGLTNLLVEGFIDFAGRGEGDPREQNTFEIYLDGSLVGRNQEEGIQWWQWTPAVTFSPSEPVILNADQVALTLGFWDVQTYYLSIFGELTLDDQALFAWQNSVYAKVMGVEQARVDKENQELLLTYNQQMSDYRNRIAELKAMSVNDLLQGQSEAHNRSLIAVELKKHCITMMTHEFDSDPGNDIISGIPAIAAVEGDFNYRRFRVREDTAPTTCFFEQVKQKILYPAIDLREARTKGRFIQFIEQAFEWPNISYLFYPYFWATQGDWIEMLRRSDRTDPGLTAFLTAGSARILLAVTPAYEEAVLHYLATGDPWDGGPTPVIGDPLFVPLHDELRKQQDPYGNAVPEGEPWTFVLPTSLVYLQDDATLPQFADPDEMSS